MKYPSIQGKRIFPKSTNQFTNLQEAKPGEFWWHEVDISGEIYNRLYFRSPVEKDTDLHGIFVIKSGQSPPPDNITYWDWNGSFDSPTLNPSISNEASSNTPWHGWLENGFWRAHE